MTDIGHSKYKLGHLGPQMAEAECLVYFEARIVSVLLYNTKIKHIVLAEIQNLIRSYWAPKGIGI